MKKLLTIAIPAVFIFGCFSHKSKMHAKAINGAGATFPYALYVKWARDYRRTTGIKVNYQGIGSGGGIRQVTERTIDFGGSDKMLSPSELKKRKLYQFPAIIGSIVVVYNLPGIGDGKLKLSNKAVCDAFMGKVNYWDNGEIKKDNPNLNLPHQRITVVHRSEGSGTTWNFTYWLSQICSEWRKNIGFGKVVDWPSGIGAKGNAGVTNYVKQTPGSIGYVEYAYKLQNKLASAQLQSSTGNFVKPDMESFKKAASHASLSPTNNFYAKGNLILQGGKESWPITAATMILLPKDGKNNTNVINFFKWAFKNGDEDAKKLSYIPLSDNLKRKIKNYWKTLDKSR